MPARKKIALGSSTPLAGCVATGSHTRATCKVLTLFLPQKRYSRDLGTSQIRTRRARSGPGPRNALCTLAKRLDRHADCVIEARLNLAAARRSGVSVHSVSPPFGLAFPLKNWSTYFLRLITFEPLFITNGKLPCARQCRSRAHPAEGKRRLNPKDATMAT